MHTNDQNRGQATLVVCLFAGFEAGGSSVAASLGVSNDVTAVKANKVYDNDVDDTHDVNDDGAYYNYAIDNANDPILRFMGHGCVQDASHNELIVLSAFKIRPSGGLRQNRRALRVEPQRPRHTSGQKAENYKCWRIIVAKIMARAGRRMYLTDIHQTFRHGRRRLLGGTGFETMLHLHRSHKAPEGCSARPGLLLRRLADDATVFPTLISGGVLYRGVSGVFP